MKIKEISKEKRTCLNCGVTWEVRKQQKKSSNVSLFCKNCLNTLTLAERQRLYRIHSGNYIEEERTCLNCGKIWKVERDIHRNYGNKKRHFCNACTNMLSGTEKKRILRKKLPGFHEKDKQLRRESHKRNIIQSMLHRAETRAKKYGYEFNLTKEDIIIPKVCPLLNVPFVLGDKDNYEYTPTIDRIDNSKGYVKGNIQIITKKANSMKNSASFEELKTFCTNILRYSLNNREKESIEQKNKESFG